MRRFLLVALLPAAMCAAATLQVVKPVVSQTEGGDPDPAGFQHVAGETIYFSCHVEGFEKSEDKVHLTYTAQAFDPRGVALADVENNAILEQISAQDKDWTPKIEGEVDIPPVVPAGDFKIVVKVKDYYSEDSAELDIPFQVKGMKVEPSDRLVVRNFGFYRAEEGGAPVPNPLFHNGASLYARWQMAGYKYGEGNNMDLSWTVAIVSGPVTLKTFDTAADKSEGAFYAKPFVDGEFDVPLNHVPPGAYTLLITVKDGAGKQNIESRHNFSVE